MNYFENCNYIDMEKKVNFDIIHHECRGDALEGLYKNYQTVGNNDLKNYPEKEKKRDS